MKVGFGSAGVEIIRNNLERGRHKDVLLLNKQGGNVSCIFLFCDIRRFTDATECLNEDIFVFTNKIAAVVHSICHAYGGSANKNIGDAFLVSWLLDDIPMEEEDIDFGTTAHNFKKPPYVAYHNQADKALLAVVKISMALHHDKYFTDAINESAKNRLLSKLSNRKGPLVQMGFGLHAGTAFQGAIGSQRKLDATYISESVEQAEFLESSTKKYGVPVLMSDSFYDLLDSSTKYRCRKVDQLLLLSGQDGNSYYDPNEILDAKKMVLVSSLCIR
jgi:class 3 adenylate cyclase